MTNNDNESALVWMNPRDLAQRPPFSNLFPRRPGVQDRILQSMREKGFNPSSPIEAWKEGNVIIDGHTRADMAVKAGVRRVPVFFVSYPSEEEALDRAVACQRDRRNMTDEELLVCIEHYDKRKPPFGGPVFHGNQHVKPEEVAYRNGTPPPSGKTSRHTAAEFGVHRHKVEKARVILADPEETEAVKKGEKSINMAYQAVKTKRKKTASPTANGKAASNGRTLVLPPVRPKQLSEEDRRFVESLPIYDKVVKYKFENDAILARELLPQIKPIVVRVREIIGDQSPAALSPFFKAFLRLAAAADPQAWVVCQVCRTVDGHSRHDCRSCAGCGYIIGGFNK